MSQRARAETTNSVVPSHALPLGAFGAARFVRPVHCNECTKWNIFLFFSLFCSIINRILYQI